MTPALERVSAMTIYGVAVNKGGWVVRRIAGSRGGGYNGGKCPAGVCSELRPHLPIVLDGRRARILPERGERLLR
jgi:hypothetical protein